MLEALGQDKMDKTLNDNLQTRFNDEAFVKTMGTISRLVSHRGLQTAYKHPVIPSLRYGMRTAGMTSMSPASV